MANVTTQEEVCEHITKHREDMVEFLSELVAAQSLPGEEQPAQVVMCEKFESFGLDIDQWEPDVKELQNHPGFFKTTPFEEYGYEGRRNIAAVDHGSGGGQSLTLSGHVDVVPPDPVDDWKHDPWDTDVEDGKMYGRGTFDMKGGIAAFVASYEALEALGVELSGDLTLQTTIEEEAGGVGGVLSALERGHQPDAAIIPEPSAVPTIGVASAGVLYFRVRVPGKAAHTAYKFLGIDAVSKGIKIYEALETLHEERNKRIKDYEPSINQYTEAKGSTTNISLTDIYVPGSWTSTVPGEVVMEYRIGWPPNTNQDRKDIKAEINETIQSVADEDDWLVEHPPEIEWFGWSTDPHEIDYDSEFFRLVCQETETVTGGTINYRGGLGGNDERFYNRYYDIPTPSVGPCGGNGHGADEYVEIDSLVETAQIFARIIMEWCGVEE